MKPYYLPVLIAVLLFTTFFRLGSVTLFDVDEAVFAEATKEMVQNGDWITPTYNGDNRYDKPIFFYWLMALSYKIFGINEFGARFPSAVSGFILCLAVFFFSKKFNGEKIAFYAAISLSMSIYFFAYSHAAVTDMALTLFITLSLFSFFLSAEGADGNPNNMHMYGFYLFSALAFLTKGLIGIIFPFGIAFTYLLIRKRPGGVKKIFNIKGMLLFLMVSSPWYISQLAINGWEFIRQFVIKHHFQRYTEVISGHRGPVYYYIPVMIIGLFPWIAFLPAGIWDVFKYRNLPVAEGEGPKKNGDAGSPQITGPFIPAAGRRDLTVFAFVWMASIVLFFSFSTTKLPNYILPSIPAISLLMAAGMSKSDDRWRRYSGIFISIVSLAIGIALVISGKYLLKSGISDAGWTLEPALIMFAISALSLYDIIFARKKFFIFLSVLMCAFIVVLSLTALPAANRFLQGPLYDFSVYARDSLRDGEKLIVYGINNPSIVFYSDRKIRNTGDINELSSVIKEQGRALVIAKKDNLEILSGLGLNLVTAKGNYAILEKK